MRSSIDLSYGCGNYFDIKDNIKEKDLKVILATTEDRTAFHAPKDQLKVHNNPRSSVDLNQAFYDQNQAKSGVRRFVEPSEGDSIFNFDKDMRKKAKVHARLAGSVPRESYQNTSADVEMQKSQSKMSMLLQKYKA